jgi:hypothetical protein
MSRRLGKGRALKKIRLRARHGSDEDIYSRRLLLDHTQMEGPRLRLDDRFHETGSHGTCG